MRAVGDKAAARRLAAENGIAILSGYEGPEQSDARLAAEAGRIGYPVLVKPSAGGGGKGMHVVPSPAEMDDTLARARREAKAAFGDGRLILERYLARPRHVEVQFLADQHGNAVHLGERECSLQRRHQKVIEESPSPAVHAELRRRLGEATLKLAAASGYTGAGTAEFLLDRDGSFFFLEVNARLQVEHPVTELVTGRDLVADQLAIATGEPLPQANGEVRFDGHAIEARLYAEDPYADFVPATGEILEATFARPEGVRVDSGIGAGDVVGTRYDPLLAKVIAHGADRDQAIDRLDESLRDSSVVGVTTNRGFLRWLMNEPDVRSADMYTTLIDERWRPESGLPSSAWPAAATALSRTRAPGTGHVPIGFRLNGPPSVRVQIGDEEKSVALSGEAPSIPFALSDDSTVVLDLDGRAVVAQLATAPTVDSAARHASGEAGAIEHVSAPMPGTVLSVRVSDGDMVEPGQVLVVLEAMKMENTVAAPTRARVERVLVREGQQVQRNEHLVELA
jgi:acetyl-CoA/propionyl-CoA carboxylase biotin carboxyl carrier protein